MTAVAFTKLVWKIVDERIDADRDKLTRQVIEQLEDEALVRAMKAVEHEPVLTYEEAKRRVPWLRAKRKRAAVRK